MFCKRGWYLKSTSSFDETGNDSDMADKSEILKRRLFIIAGTIFLVVGIIGIIIPVLPTTPLLLLAAICYTRGSQRLYELLVRNRICGSYLRNYLEGKCMSRTSKIWTIGLLWISLITTAVFLTESTTVRLILGVVLAGVTIHILTIRTLRRKLGVPGTFL